MRRDFAKISREIRTAKPHVPEVYLTVTRGISRERTQKIPQARLYLRAAKPNVSVAQENKFICEQLYHKRIYFVYSFREKNFIILL